MVALKIGTEMTQIKRCEVIYVKSLKTFHFPVEEGERLSGNYSDFPA